jgi:hypothetical protein
VCFVHKPHIGQLNLVYKVYEHSALDFTHLSTVLTRDTQNNKFHFFVASGLVMLCSLVGGYKRFGRMYCLLQGLSTDGDSVFL